MSSCQPSYLGSTVLNQAHNVILKVDFLPPDFADFTQCNSKLVFTPGYGQFGTIIEEFYSTLELN